jgi:16S rRNA processing protein RimM
VERPAHLVVGLVKKPHGIKGEVLVYPATDEPETVFVPGRVLAVLDRDGRATGREIVIARARAFHRAWLLGLEGVGTRELVDPLREKYLGLRAEEARPLEPGEYYHHELVGLRVETEDGRAVGAVADVIEAPQGLILSVDGEGGGKQHLVPFVSRVVRRVDREAGVMVIAPPEGLLEV